MTRVSAKKLSNKLVKELSEEFVGYVRKANKGNTADFFASLLTSTEQIMLAKRIAAIAMLHEGCSVYHVAQALSMSTSTIAGMERSYKNGNYVAVTRTMKMNKAEREKFWKTLEVILRGGMPSRGKDRWKWLDKYYPRK